MIHFKRPQFLHWKKLLKHQKGCHHQRHVKLIEHPARFAQLENMLMSQGVSSHMRSSAVWLPHVILQVQVSLMGMGILKRLSEINISIEEMSR